MMNDKLKRILASVGLLGAFGLGGAALAGAQGDKPADQGTASQPAGADAGRAGQAALRAAGGGKVVSVEKETPDTGADQAEPGDKPDSAEEQARDQEVAYDVEVRKTDGTTLDVEVDDAFTVLSTEQDEAEGPESGSEADEAPAQR